MQFWRLGRNLSSELTYKTHYVEFTRNLSSEFKNGAAMEIENFEDKHKLILELPMNYGEVD